MKAMAIVLVLLSPCLVLAQEYAFKVLVNKGQNEIRSGSNWQAIKVGAILRAADELKVSANGYVGLVHASGKPLEVKEAGRHKVADLAGQVREGSSVLHQYTDFILSNASPERNNLMATGAVHRGTSKIRVFLPDPKQAVVFHEKVAVTWARDPETKLYRVRLNSMFGDELDQYEVRDTSVVIDLSAPKLANEDNILVMVSSSENSDRASESFMLKKLSAADKVRIRSSLANVAALTAEQTALNNLYLASFFENNKLLIDAATAYQQAIRLAPDVPYFQEAFNDFLLRNGLKTADDK